MSKQTAVELLEEEIKDLISNDIGSQLKFKNKVKKAKEMEKQQIIEACNQIEVIGLDHELAGEKYYNETFNK